MNISIEIMPPLRTGGLQDVERFLEKVCNIITPTKVNVTTHRSQAVIKFDYDIITGIKVKQRPSTIAIAARLKTQFNLNVVPHLICSGFSIRETESALLDLSYLGIDEVFCIRGDKANYEHRFTPHPSGFKNSLELINFIKSETNNGIFHDGTEAKSLNKFKVGAALYPEGRIGQLNSQSESEWTRKKEEAGVDYFVTQMCWNINALRDVHANVPVHPGVKILKSVKQAWMVAETFGVQIPVDLVEALESGRFIDWHVSFYRQVLNKFGSLHFYATVGDENILTVLKELI